MAALPAHIPAHCGLLLVDHGSRLPTSNRNLTKIRDMVRKLTHQDPRIVTVDHAHMELAQPTIEEAVKRMKATHGAKHIQVVPYFLSKGRHVTSDIPKLVKSACRAHGVGYDIAPALGPHVDLAALLLKRAGGVKGSMMVVDHGSLKATSNKQLLTVVDDVRRLVGNKVRGVHMEIAKPSIEDGFRAVREDGADKSVHVMPYFLSEGRHTTTDIPKLVAESAKKHNLQYKISPPLGPHEDLAKLLIKRAFPGYTNPAKDEWRTRHGPEEAYPEQPAKPKILKTLFKELTATTEDKLRIAVSLGTMVASKGLGVRSAVELKYAVDSLKSNTGSPAEHMLKYVGYKLVAAVLQEGKEVVFGPVTQRVRRRVMEKAYTQLQGLDHEFLSKRSHGGLVRVLQRGERALDRVGSILVFQFLPTAVELGMVSRALRKVDVGYAVGTMVMAGAYGAWSVPATHFRARFKKVMNHSEDLAAVRATDALQNHQLVALENTKHQESAKYVHAQNLYSAAALSQQRCLSTIRLGQRLIFTTSFATIITLAARHVTTSHITLGDLLLIKTLMTQLTRPMELLGAYYRELQSGLADLRQLFTFIHTKPKMLSPSSNHLPVKTPPTTPLLSLNNVSYSYPGTPSPLSAVSDVSMKVYGGEVVAVVGESGCGKTTLCKMIPRLVDPTGGVVEVKGVDVRSVGVEALRRGVAVVPQGDGFVRDTVQGNITYGQGERTRWEVEEAAGKAAMGGVDLKGSMLGLSGGERQRVSLARAFLKDAPLIVLDEPTSSLDRRATSAIYTSMFANRSPDKAVVVVAHHLPNPHLFDRIHVMRKGRIIASGTHSNLLETCGYYKTLRSKSG